MKAPLFIILLALSSGAYCQFGKGSPAKMKDLSAKTLLVCLYDHAENYNANIKEIVEERWKYGKYEFVNYSEIKANKTNRRSDVLMLYLYGFRTGTSSVPLTASTLSIGEDKDLYSQVFLNYYGRGTGGTAGLGFIMYADIMDESISLANSFSKERLNLIFSVLLNTFDILKKEDADLGMSFTLKKVKEYYNNDAAVAKLKQGTLYIPKADIADKKPNGKTDTELLQAGALGEYYQNKYKVVKEDELSTAIAAKEKNTFYLHSALQGSIIVYFVVDLETQKVIYLDFAHGSYGDITSYKSMLKELNKVISN